MKTKILNIVFMLLLLNLLVACGGESTSSNQTEVQNSTMTISVKKPSSPNAVFIGGSNSSLSTESNSVDLEIASIKICVYEENNETDMNSITCVDLTKFTSVDDSIVWKGTINNLELGKTYIFVAEAKNEDEKRIFAGRTSETLQMGGTNAVNINLVQTPDLFTSDNIPVIPTANFSGASENNGEIVISWGIHNPQNKEVNWSILDKDCLELSDEFSENNGTTTESIWYGTTYTPLDSSENQAYCLKLTSTESETTYRFNIADYSIYSSVAVTVNMPPIITSMNAKVEGNSLTVTPVLENELNTTTYKWSITNNNSEIIQDATKKIVVIQNYSQDSNFELRLDVNNTGASSYRIYTIGEYPVYAKGDK